MTSPAPTALILDFGGVLTTSLWESIRGCARRDGLPEDALLKLLREDPQIRTMFTELELGSIGQHAFESALGSAAGISPNRLLERMCADLRPDRAMLRAVNDFRRADIRIGVLSNSWGSGYFSPYKGYNLEGRADAIIYSDRVKLRKPDPAIFELILRELGAAAEATVFVDDIALNLTPAQKMGMRTVHHVESAHTIETLEAIFATALPRL